jgi:hypothetical protein
VPHRLDPALFQALLPGFTGTTFAEMVAAQIAGAAIPA